MQTFCARPKRNQASIIKRASFLILPHNTHRSYHPTPRVSHKCSAARQAAPHAVGCLAQSAVTVASWGAWAVPATPAPPRQPSPPTRPCPRELGRVGRKKGETEKTPPRKLGGRWGRWRSHRNGELTVAAESENSVPVAEAGRRATGAAHLAAQLLSRHSLLPPSHPHKNIRSQHQFFCRFSLSSHSHTACFIFISAAACGGHPAPCSLRSLKRSLWPNARLFVDFVTAGWRHPDPGEVSGRQRGHAHLRLRERTPWLGRPP